MIRPIFRRELDYVVVKRIPRSNIDFSVGHVIKNGDMPAHILRRWLRHRLIGPEGHAWTNEMLGIHEAKEVCSKEAPVEEAPVEEAPVEEAPVEEVNFDEPYGVTYEHAGGPWYDVLMSDGTTNKVKGKSLAEELCDVS